MFHIIVEASAIAIKVKDIEGTQEEKKEVKVSLFSGNTIFISTA